MSSRTSESQPGEGFGKPSADISSVSSVRSFVVELMEGEVKAS